MFYADSVYTPFQVSTVKYKNKSNAISFPNFFGYVKVIEYSNESAVGTANRTNLKLSDNI